MIDTSGSSGGRTGGGRPRKPRRAVLQLNGVAVGDVTIRPRRRSWCFGEFTPGPGFVEFAPLFACWSRLMRAARPGERLTASAARELRAAECAIDALRAELLLKDPDECRVIRQLNIDGWLIEWKE